MISEVTVEAVRSEHAGVRVLIRQLRAVEKDLSEGGHGGVQVVLAGILDDMVRHLYREMRQEEALLYPSLVGALGSDVPVRALEAEHRTTRDLIQGLRELNRRDGRGWAWEERLQPLRTKVRRLADVLELHLRREEAAFGALVATPG